MGKQHKKISTQNIWLFCEGKKTERNYFEGLRITERINNLTVIDSKRTDIQGLLKESIKFKNDRARKDDQIYCIFDRNGNSKRELKAAIGLAKKHKINLIFSNPCFEYWILCHYEKYGKPIEYAELKSRLDKYLGNYNKADKGIYYRLRSKYENAMKNVEAVNGTHLKKISKKSNPSTSVGSLVKLLLRKKK